MDAGKNGNDVPLRIPLPEPPFLTLGGIEYVLVRVRIDQLEAWRLERDLVPVRQAFLGRPGWRPTSDGTMRWAGYGTVTLHWPRALIKEVKR